MKRITAYTDGSCLNKSGPKAGSGPGGWAYLFEAESDRGVLFVFERSGGDAHTTNNKMEMQSIIQLLKDLPEGCDVTIYSDSQYVLKSITKNIDIDSWLSKKEDIDGWIRKSIDRLWRTDAKNLDLWQQLVEEMYRHFNVKSRFNFRWVKGHSGHPQNEKVDTLARDEATKFLRKK
mgnify:CR=1 FL=1